MKAINIENTQDLKKRIIVKQINKINTFKKVNRPLLAFALGKNVKPSFLTLLIPNNQFEWVVTNSLFGLNKHCFVTKSIINKTPITMKKIK